MPASATSNRVRTGAVSRMPWRVMTSSARSGAVAVWSVTPGGAQPASIARDGQMHRVRDDVSEVEQVERALVRDHAAPLADGEPDGQNLLVRRGRVIAEVVEAAHDADEAPRRCVMGQEALADAAVMSLSCLEVTSLF